MDPSTAKRKELEEIKERSVNITNEVSTGTLKICLVSDFKQ